LEMREQKRVSSLQKLISGVRFSNDFFRQFFYGILPIKKFCQTK
jgi:hypothetical protein